MAKRISKVGRSSSGGSSAVKKTTSVRNTPIPKVPAVAARKEITHEMIAVRAYEIWQSGLGGSELDNWLRAEQELRSL